MKARRNDISRREWLNWKWQFGQRIKSVSAAIRQLPLRAEESAELAAVAAIYPFAVTPYYLSLIDWSNPDDPIKKQCIPSRREIDFTLPDSRPDPLCEKDYTPVPSLIHRYDDRALLLTSSRCAVYCRHCNRKRFWGKSNPSFLQNWPQIREYLSNRPQIREVILSGGDPLILRTDILEYLLKSVRAVKHIEVIRIGTRTPVVMPMRITEKLCRMLERYRPMWINTQFNHAREITAEAAKACDRLLKAGIPLSNQTVLLKGINDTLNDLKELFQGLQRIMVRPYYLFQCEAVKGADHFRTPLQIGIDIMEQLWCRTGGLCLPEFVADLPQGYGKARLLPSHIVNNTNSETIFRTFEGKIVHYPTVANPT
ncbi:MAG: KamA family radical SAM protein [Dissulfuribacterales bacterium]